MPNNNFDGDTVVLVDGQNFRYKLPNWTRLRVNYFNLSQVLFETNPELAARKMRVIYFDMFTIEKSATEFSSIEAKNGYIDHLQNNGVEIKTQDANSLPLKQNGRRKDTNMDRYIIRALQEIAEDSQVKYVVLMSGDGDFHPHLRRIINAGKKATVICVRETLSPKILDDEDIRIIYFEDVKKILLE